MRIGDYDCCVDNYGRKWTVVGIDNHHPDFIDMEYVWSEHINEYVNKTVCLVCRNGTFISVGRGRAVTVHDRHIVEICDFDLGI